MNIINPTSVLTHLFSPLRLLLVMALACATAGSTFAQFVHPGVYHTRDDLDVAKNNQGNEPWKSALAALQANPKSSLTYVMKGPFAQVNGGTDNTNGSAFRSDMSAAYQQAVLWYLTGNQTYADNAKRIYNGWSSTLANFGSNNAVLLVALAGGEWAAGAEILRYSNAGWAAADITRFEGMLRNKFLPFIRDFTPVNGANWSTACIESVMAIAVFLNDQTLFNSAWAAFTSTADCPNDYSVTKNIAASGQNVESGRDQIHSLMSYRQLARAAEIAYIQGRDPWSIAGNRILTGYEYWCKYNLGNTVPYDTAVYRCRAGWGPWSVISPTGRGVPSATTSTCANLVYRAYVTRRGLSAPYTSQMRALVNPSSPLGEGQVAALDTLLFQPAPGGPVPNGTYSIQNRATGMMIDNHGSTGVGADVGQWTNSSSTNQRWRLTYTNGYYTLTCVSSGMNLDSMNRKTSGLVFGQYTANGGVNQQFTLQPTDYGYYRIVSRANTLVVDGAGGITNPSPLKMWTTGSSNNLQWRFVAP